MKISLPSYGYHKMYLGRLTIDENSMKIESTQTINLGKNVFIPIDQAGLTGTLFDVEKLKDLLEKIKGKDKNEFPILFVYDDNYANQYTTKIKFLAGIVFDEEGSEGKSSYQFILGYTTSNNTTCTRKPHKSNERCRLFFIIFTNKELIDKIKPIRNIDVYVKRGKNSSPVRGKEFKLIYADSMDVKVYQRTFPIISANKEYLLNDNDVISYFPINVETIYLGSQLYAKEYYVREFKDDSFNIKKLYYFVYPLLVLYTIFHENKNKNDRNSNHTKPDIMLEPILLPKERVFESFALKINLSNLTWEYIEKLVDWLFKRHPESLLKILLTNELLDQINKYLQDEKIIAKNTMPPPLEITIQTKIGRLNLQYGSYILQRIMKIYYNMQKTNDFRSFLFYFLELVYKLKNESFEIIGNKKINENENILRDIKRMIGVFALMYGLHGISHLMMKVLEIKTKMHEFGERVIININPSELKISNYFSSLQEFVKENVFEIRSDDQIENPITGSVLVFSKIPYSYSYFADIFGDEKLNRVKIDIIKEELKKILELNEKDSCEVKHEYERNLLLPTLNMLRRNDHDLILKLENKILDFSTNKILPPRTLFRFLYEKFIVPDLKMVDLKNKQHRIKLNQYAQFVIHYHVPSCVDGCYNCVLTPRNVSSTMCDLPPVQQELKTSKWIALCLLKHIGIIDYSWVDCDL